MRPHKLTMKAFGPFARETVVDFDSMANNIYLISGETGSGKTTIFDGIVYALYGTASGGARSGLGTEAFHSDYAKDGNHRDELRVELVFSNADRTFTVSRRMYWGKRGDAQKAVKESTLSENGNTIANGKGVEYKDDVTAKIKEILGLDADQFRRIIMLAQGEFQRFLTAGSGERGEILGKLYDNRQHQDFQQRLKAARKWLKDRDAELTARAETILNAFSVPETAAEEDRGAVAVNHAMLFPTMQHIIEAMETELGELQQYILEQSEILDKLKAEETTGKEHNDQLEKLAQKKSSLAKLEEQKDRIVVLRELVDRAEAAAKVLPHETHMLAAEKAWKDLLERIQKLEEERDRLAAQAAELKTRADEIKAANEPQIKALQDDQSVLQRSLELYDKLKEAVDDLTKKRGALKAAGDAAKSAGDTVQKKQDRQTELAKTLERLSAAGEAAVELAKKMFGEVERRSKDLADFQTAIGNVKKLEREAEALREAHRAACEAELKAEETHLRLNKAFLEGQAGILAGDLRERLRTEPEVRCPVCGAIHTQADEGMFAPRQEDIPTREDVDKAFDAYNTARNKTNQAQEELAKKTGEIEHQKDTILQKTQTLISVSDWDVLTEGTVLTEAAEQCKADLAAAKAKYEQAVSEKAEKDKALEEKSTADSAVESAKKTLTEAETKENNARTDAAAAETTVSERKDQMKGLPETKEEAQKQIEDLGGRILALRTQIDNAEREHAGCVEKQAANTGALNNAYSVRADREREKNDAAAEFAKQLEVADFSDADAYHAALSPDGKPLDRDALSAWVSRKKTDIDEYAQKHGELEAAVKQLEETTKGFETVDLAALEKRIEELNNIIAAKRKAEQTLAGHIGRNKEVFGETKKILKLRARYLKVLEKVKPMADTADGRYAFSRYVLTGFFDRIVEQANVHLGTMTDGEYSLVPTEEGDGRTSVGLGLKVLNTITNLERDTASLSGGQMFEASLSLALGLSDVVQMESTGSIQIDSMFIDEGFGSLDSGKLDRAIDVLWHLSAGQRQIGIISHVARLDECLPRKIHVIAGKYGSTVKIETDA